MTLDELTLEERRLLADAMGTTSEATLRAIAQGRRKASSARAIEIETVARALGFEIQRESLNNGCAVCEFAKQCRKAT